ncbi:MAG: hypothetical protein CMM60_01485 [Rhodospirillaceae bacterium]|jgi:hypothetical protein|nr:hypothetical protein [Rhodospirillaceae bacterium]
MANSGIPWIDLVFDTAVRWLLAWADFFGITYEEINVWLFCILWPLLTAVQTVAIIYLWRRSQIAGQCETA